MGRGRVRRPGAFLLRKAPSARVQIEPVQLRGIIGERGVALGLHPRDDRSDVGGHIGIALAPIIDQRVELGREAGFGSIKPPHRRRSRSSGLPPAEKIGSTSCRERVCQYESISVVDVSLYKKTKIRTGHKITNTQKTITAYT